MKSYAFLRFLLLPHQPPDGLKNGVDVLVVPLDLALQFVKFGSQVFVQGKCFAQFQEGPHNDDIDRIASSLFKTLDNMAIPCSVKT